MLFEDKHGFELFTLIPMCLRPLVGLRVQLKFKCRLPVTSCIVLTRFGSFLYRLVKDKNFKDGCYFEDTLTYV